MTDANIHTYWVTALGLNSNLCIVRTSLQFQFSLMDGKIKIWHEKKCSRGISITVLVRRDVCVQKHFFSMHVPYLHYYYKPSNNKCTLAI